MGLSNVDPHNYLGLVARTNLSEKQYHFVRITEAEELELCGAGEAGYVLVDTPEAGQGGTIVVGAEVQKVIYKAAIKIGDLLASDAEGEAVKAATGNVILAKALAAGASGDICTVLTVTPVAILA